MSEAAGHPREDQIELPVDLIAQHDLGGDLAAPVRDPGGLRGQRLIATLRWTTATADQAEELFNVDAGPEAPRFLELLAALVEQEAGGLR